MTLGIGMTSRRTRERLISRLHDKGITNGRVLQIMSEVERHRFVDEALATRAYEDDALPIGYGQTISQPFIVAHMTSLLIGDALSPTSTERLPWRVLEVGTGCGYQTAILSRLVDRVYTIERIAPLMETAKKRLISQHYRNIHYRLADGSAGWPEAAPFDGIITTACAERPPEALKVQLAIGGRLVIPVESGARQALHVITRTDQDSFEEVAAGDVRFVPLVSGAVERTAGP